jgi:hypothetical protein
VLLLSFPYLLAAPASRQGVSVGVELVAQRPALAKHHLHLGHLSPRLLRPLALPRSQREELTRVFHAPNQNEGLGPRCVIQRPLDEGSPRIDELLLASCPNQPFTRAVNCPVFSICRSPSARLSSEWAITLSTAELAASQRIPCPSA